MCPIAKLGNFLPGNRGQDQKNIVKKDASKIPVEELIESLDRTFNRLMKTKKSRLALGVSAGLITKEEAELQLKTRKKKGA